MTRRTRALAVLGAAAYAAFMVALLPARFVVARLALPPGIAVQEVDGTVWNGRARVAWSAAPAVTVRWHWRALPLFAARLAYDLEADGAGVQARTRLARGLTRWTLENAELRGDASAAAAFLPLLAPWQPGGRIELIAPRLAWDGREVTGSADVRWTDAALALAPVRPLGTYTVHLEGTGGPARVRISTAQGALRIAGDGTLEGLDRIAFTGEARAEGPNAASLNSLLDLFGPARPDGARAIRWSS